VSDQWDGGGVKGWGGGRSVLVGESEGERGEVVSAVKRLLVLYLG